MANVRYTQEKRIQVAEYNPRWKIFRLGRLESVWDRSQYRL